MKAKPAVSRSFLGSPAPLLGVHRVRRLRVTAPSGRGQAPSRSGPPALAGRGQAACSALTTESPLETPIGPRRSPLDAEVGGLG